MSYLAWVIEKIAALFVACGCPAKQSVFYTLILLYLLTTGLLAGLLIAVIVRRRNRGRRSLVSPPDLES